MRKTLTTLLIAVAIVLTGTPAWAGRPDPIDRGVYVVGDSIAWRINRAPVRMGHPRWTFEAFPGRRVTALGEDFIPPTSSYTPAVTHMFTPHPARRVGSVIIALGTNGADGDLSLSQAAALYAAGVNRLRSADIWRKGPKRIILVTPYRVPSIAPGAVDANGVPYQSYQWAYKQGLYARAMHYVAAHTGHVCIMPWRRYVSQHPRKYLIDGIHPNPTGKRLWRSLAERAVRRC